MLSNKYCSNLTASNVTVTAFARVAEFLLFSLNEIDSFDSRFITSFWIVYWSLLVSGSVVIDAVDSRMYG